MGFEIDWAAYGAIALCGALLYLMAYWFDKPWRCPFVPMHKRVDEAQMRIDIIEGTRENWSWWVELLGEKHMARENKELEKLYKFVRSHGVVESH